MQTIVRIFLVIAIVLLLGVYFYWDPREFSFFPSCPFTKLTGYDCPGCGVQRALHELLNFRFKTAFLLNPLFVILLFLSVVYLLLISFFPKSKMVGFVKKNQNLVLAILVGVIFLFLIIRNTSIYINFIGSLE